MVPFDSESEPNEEKENDVRPDTGHRFFDDDAYTAELRCNPFKIIVWDRELLLVEVEL